MKLAAMVMIVLTTSACDAVANDSLHGLWIEPDMGAMVRLGYCEDGVSLCGRVETVTDDSRRFDTKNPDPTLRGRDLVGQYLLWNFKPDGLNRWLGGGKNGALPGRIYLPINGDTLGDAKNTYEIVFDGKDSLTIRKAGCWACLLSSRWQRGE